MGFMRFWMGFMRFSMRNALKPFVFYWFSVDVWIQKLGFSRGCCLIGGDHPCWLIGRDQPKVLPNIFWGGMWVLMNSGMRINIWTWHYHGSSQVDTRISLGPGTANKNNTAETLSDAQPMLDSHWHHWHLLHSSCQDPFAPKKLSNEGDKLVYVDRTVTLNIDKHCTKVWVCVCVCETLRSMASCMQWSCSVFWHMDSQSWSG